MRQCNIARLRVSRLKLSHAIDELRAAGSDFDMIPLDIVDAERRDSMEYSWIIQCIDRGEPLINVRPPRVQPTMTSRKSRVKVKASPVCHRALGAAPDSGIVKAYTDYELEAVWETFFQHGAESRVYQQALEWLEAEQDVSE